MGCRWDSLKVLSTHPKADAAFFRKLNRRRPLSIIDVGSALAEPKPAQAIMEIVEHGRDPKKRPLIIGDWLHEVYNRFEIGLEAEESESRANVDNLICCYRRDGLSSLAAKQMGRAIELHQRLLLGTTTFDKAFP
jgi:hypothetical protein